MWPWGHLAFAYLCLLLVSRISERVTQSVGVVVALVVGSQFPDLVDKPLAWSVTVLPSGRSLAHSLLTAAVVLYILSRLSARYDRQDLVASFGVGWVSHSLSDLGPGVIIGLLRGDMSQIQWTTYLLWPVLESPPYPNDDSFAVHFSELQMTPYVTAQFLLLGLAVGLWFVSGAESARTVRVWLRSNIQRF
ncbi:metal-dependent hydrolase [Halopenitus persicus]|uniref:metal-dependent hydrolase n=1 Tax=Halopenitus persicus TaxID=1048396 RepID=UPI000AE6D5B8